MQVAAQLSRLDEHRQLAPPRCLELARVLTQLRRDVRVAEPLVDLLLVDRGDDLAALDLGDAVLGDRQPTSLDFLAQRDVVILRAGEVLQQVPVALRRDHTQVEAETLVRDDRRLRRAFRRDLGDPRQLREVVDQRLGIVRSRDDVQVADRLLAPPRAAGFGDAVGGRMLAQHLDDRQQRGERAPEQRSR